MIVGRAQQFEVDWRCSQEPRYPRTIGQRQGPKRIMGIIFQHAANESVRDSQLKCASWERARE